MVGFWSAGDPGAARGQVIGLPLLCLAAWLFLLPRPFPLCAWLATAAVPLALLCVTRTGQGWNPLARTPIDAAPALLVLCVTMSLRALTDFDVLNPYRFWLCWLVATCLAASAGCRLLGRKSVFLLLCAGLYAPLPVLLLNAVGDTDTRVRPARVLMRCFGHCHRNGNSYHVTVQQGEWQHEFEVNTLHYRALAPGKQVCVADRTGRFGIVTGRLQACPGR